MVYITKKVKQQLKQEQNPSSFKNRVSKKGFISEFGNALFNQHIKNKRENLKQDILGFKERVMQQERPMSERKEALQQYKDYKYEKEVKEESSFKKGVSNLNKFSKNLRETSIKQISFPTHIKSARGERVKIAGQYLRKAPFKREQASARGLLNWETKAFNEDNERIERLKERNRNVGLGGLL